MTAFYHSLPVNVTGFMGVAEWASDVTSGFIWDIFVLVVFMSVFMFLKRYQTEQALLVSSMAAMIVSVIMVSLGLVNSITMVIMFIITVVSLFTLREK